MKMVETIRKELSEKQDNMAEEVSMIKAMVKSQVFSQARQVENSASSVNDSRVVLGAGV